MGVCVYESSCMDGGGTGVDPVTVPLCVWTPPTNVRKYVYELNENEKSNCRLLPFGTPNVEKWASKRERKCECVCIRDGDGQCE